MVTREDLVEFLNELVSIDSNAIKSLVDTRVPCNENLADHPSVEVLSDVGENKVGLLGILNGVFNDGTDLRIFVTEDEDPNVPIKFGIKNWKDWK